MLDNFKGEELRQVAQSLKKKFAGTNKSFLLECSGGLTLQNLSSYLMILISILLHLFIKVFQL